ncbi:MAG: carbonic anhydrase [Elusimicrobium sp.]|jgi:carbonic anhydrase|nr:carbonic anhydrase [Elusimicrobium sp.]
MSYIDEMLAFNKQFVKNKLYKSYNTTKFPNKKIAVLSCMDTRLSELIPAALNFKNGDVKIIKNAGAVVSHPFGSVMRSLMIAVYSLGVEDILVIGHHDCGMQGMKASKIIGKMAERNIKKDKLDFIRQCGVDVEKWLTGFDSAHDSVRETVNIIRSHPLIPSDVRVHGFMIDPSTGKLDKI